METHRTEQVLSTQELKYILIQYKQVQQNCTKNYLLLHLNYAKKIKEKYGMLFKGADSEVMVASQACLHRNETRLSAFQQWFDTILIISEFLVSVDIVSIFNI